MNRFNLITLCPHGLVVMTPPFHGGNRGSIPLGGTYIGIMEIAMGASNEKIIKY